MSQNEKVISNHETLARIQKQVIDRYTGDTLSAVIQINNFKTLSDMLFSEDGQKSINNFAEIISGLVLHKKSEDFHESLNIFEKQGFISSAKQEAYEFKMKITAGAVAMGVSLGSAFLAYAAEGLSNHFQKKRVRHFFMNWISYINQDCEITNEVITNTHNIVRAFGSRKSWADIKDDLEERRSSSIKLPHKTMPTVLNDLEKDMLVTIAKTVISTSEIDDSKVRERASEFLCEAIPFLTYNEAESVLKDVSTAQGHLTQLLTFSTFDFASFFSSFVSSFEETVNICTYEAERDIYSRNRKKNKERAINIASKILDMGKIAASARINKNPAELLEGFKPLEDIILISGDMSEYIVNPEKDAKVGLDLLNLRGVRDEQIKKYFR